MEHIDYPTSGVYVAAVSGGVDSVVLLSLLAQISDLKLIVAHFDHGIRPESADDAAFVAQLATEYRLEYRSEKGRLGADADEALAREARYDFLQRVKDEFAADAIVTAHHQDDVVETMVINLLRGTGWKGLCSLRSTSEVKRPLLAVKKQEIKAYARGRHLEWREDSTNQSDVYLRNRVRKYVMPYIVTEAWMTLYHRQAVLLDEINHETKQLMTDRRYFMIMAPREVAIELLRAQIPMTRPQAQRALHFIKSGRAGAVYDIGGGNKIKLSASRYIFNPEA
jgi:tRNA(Ile)-lysidine synthase